MQLNHKLEELSKTTSKLKTLNSLIVFLFITTMLLMVFVLVINKGFDFLISYQSNFTDILISTGILTFLGLLLFDKVRTSGDSCFESLVDQSHAGNELTNRDNFKSLIKAYGHSAELPIFKGKQGLLILAVIDLQMVIFGCVFQI